MVARMLSALIILHLVSVLIPTGCDRKTRKEHRTFALPTYQIHRSQNLPHDVQISTLLTKGETKRFFYDSPVVSGALSVTLTSCTSPVRWIFNQPNSSIDNFFLTNSSMVTHHVTKVVRGRYTLEISASVEDALVHVYVSTEQGGPQALQISGYQKLRLLPRQRRKRLTVKWNPSLVDPQGTTYCLTVSTKTFHPTLCSIQTTELPLQDPLIICVGRKTHHTLPDMQHGQTYYLNLFATNHQSNFTYPYASATTVFDNHMRPVNLKDAKANFANLKKLDGKAVFRYKVPKANLGKSLDFFIMPCGGAVDVEVAIKDLSVVPPERIESFGRVSVANPLNGVRYYLKIFAANREELRKTTGVEVVVYATTRNVSRIPLPNMPREVRIQEYNSLKTCDSVTIGYLAAPVQKFVNYCLTVKEGRIKETGDFTMLNQCGLDSRLRKSADFDAKYCRHVKYDKEQVVVQKVPKLKPGRHYIVQVTVKKPQGKTLSYDLLQVSTKRWCHHHKNQKRF